MAALPYFDLDPTACDGSCGGFGGRPTYVSGFRNAGPGAYEPCLSTSKAKSPIDGPESATSKNAFSY